MEKINTIKRNLVYMLLCIYVFGLINPLMPLAKDFVAHAFFKAEHLATVHLENGKFHVHAELQQEANDESNSSENPPSADEVLANHISGEEIIFTVYRVGTLSISHLVAPANVDVLLETFIPPPRI